MSWKGSRYDGARAFVADSSGIVPFPGQRPREIGPAVGVLEHLIKEGDRLDLLAHHYYNDPRLWWRILDANPEILCGATLSLSDYVGRVVLVPKSKE